MDTNVKSEIMYRPMYDDGLDKNDELDKNIKPETKKDKDNVNSTGSDTFYYCDCNFCCFCLD